MRVLRQFLLVITLIGAVAQTMAASVRVNGASIFVNEVEVVKLRAGAGGQSPADRAANLGPLLQVELAKGSPAASASGANARITVGGSLWLIVTPEEANAAGSTPLSLATSWAKSIAEAAALPPLKVDARNLKAPAGGMRYVSLTGSAVQEAQVKCSDPKVASVSKVGATVVVQGIAPGNAQVVVTSGASSVSVDLTVMPLAAYFPQSIVASVTGNPASRDTVAGALVAAVNSDLNAVDGAQLEFSPPKVVEVPNGDSKTYQVRVKATGPMSYPSEGLVTVTVKNTALGYRSEAELWYSNNPESVKKPMRLFVAGLKRAQPVRMLYHHMNVANSAMIMNVEAINNSNTPARVLIIPGDATPDPNPVTAGFEAADQFVRSWSKYSGEIVTIPPYSILPISLRRMTKNDTVSGLCYLRLLDGGPDQVIVRADTRWPSVVEKKWKLAMSSPTPWRVAGFKKIGDLASVPMPDTVHIYPHPFKEEDVLYSVGGPYGFVRIGQRPIARQDNQGALDGNFGVMYTIKLSLENNTANPAEVDLIYEASAGYCAALFVIDGDFRKTPMLKPKEETRVGRIRLEPYSTKSVQIMTLPLSGSAYPSTLTIRPANATTRNSTQAKS